MLPLDGVRVLDLTRLLPGAYATLVLAEMGADVIKLEDPRGGDPVRQTLPLVDGASVYHRTLNRNKRSVTLDLRARDAAAVIDALVARADVLVESFRPSTARRLKVSAADLLPRHPRLVHCSITGFGQSGPYVERAGHDINYVALAGLLAIDRSSADEPPRVPRQFLADIAGGGLGAVNGILAALFARERIGRGGAVDVSMHEGALGWLTFPAGRALVGGGDLDPADVPIASGRDACYNLYRTADGRYLALGALEPKFWARFCERIGRPDFIPLQFASGETQARVLDEVSRIMRSRSQAEWIEHFDGVDACLTAVNSVEEALNDPHARARGAVVEQGSSRFVRLSPRFTDLEQSSSPFPVPRSAFPEIRPAPALGADTDEVLEAAGLNEAERARLRAACVI